MGLHILFVTPYVPSKVRVRPYAFIRELDKLGHRVTLACLVQPSYEQIYLSEIEPYCEAVHPVYLRRFDPYLQTAGSFFTRQPLSVAYCDSPDFQNKVEELSYGDRFDLIHTEFIRATPITYRLNGFPKVYDAVDSLTLSYRRSITAANIPSMQRLIALVEWLKMRDYEPWIIQHYDKVVVSSPIDKNTFNSARREVEIIPNGVDLNYFNWYKGPREENSIVFLGKMSYYVNIASVLWFYHNVFPLVRRHHPKVRFNIVGRNPTPVITALGKDRSVEVTGTVPDVRPYLTKSTIAVCPMVSGAGIQNKMLEAMAMGLPCVATSLACQALQTQNGYDVLVADTAEDYANAISELLDHPEHRCRLAENGRHYVEQHHNWNGIGKQLDKLYRELLKTSTY